MIDFKKKLITGIASGAILLNAFTPFALASTTIEISGNGSSSDNEAKVTTSTTTTVVQDNTAKVTNNVDADATTGNNDANDNTGGDVTINTGKADTNVDVTTKVNANHADVNACNCQPDADVLISGNGSYSDNEAKLKTSSDISVFQTNAADVRNDVDADAKTGGNDAKRNTGGDVTITTGDASTDVDVRTKANANIADVGGNNGGSSDISLKIVGNGSYSDNDIKLKSKQSVVLVQDNKAYIYNDVDADAKTGHNDANDNTGGDVTINTGDADTNVDVDNMVNFNAADIDCGCLTDVLAKISGNGTDSDNEIKAKIEKILSDFQENASDLYNYVDADAKTGKNDAKRNTGPVVHDPTEIMTGDATSNTDVDNSGNVNVLGPNGDWHLPEGVHFDFHFDLGVLLSLLHLV